MEAANVEALDEATALRERQMYIFVFHLTASLNNYWAFKSHV